MYSSFIPFLLESSHYGKKKLRVTSMKALIFIDPTLVFLPRVMKRRCWNPALAWTRKLNLNVRRTKPSLEFYLCIQHLLFEHQKRCFFHRLWKAQLFGEFILSPLIGSWFQWHFWLKLKSQNTKASAHLLLSRKEEIYSVQCKNTWQAIHLLLNFQNLPDCIFY